VALFADGSGGGCAGIQDKVLEAMACGVPVVASPQASSALLAQVDHDLLIAYGGDAFAAASLKRLNSPALGRQFSEAGRHDTVQHYRWDGITAGLEAVYFELIGAGGQHAC
jgi:polysaccharide biosynthesis protein PslH